MNKMFYIMKKILVILIMCFSIFSTFAQNTINFLGIPVDGTKKEMINKLESKGFEYSLSFDCLVGEFNGEESVIAIQTVNNKVWRVAVTNASPYNEINAKIKFNKLLKQFSNNGKYVILDGENISDNEDISYEILVNKKRYCASFRFKDETINGCVWYTLLQEGNEYFFCIFYENLNNEANGNDL